MGMEREDHNKNELHDNRRKPVNKRIDDAYARYMADQNNHRIETNFRTIFVVVLASLIMAINLKSFVDQGDLVPGGFNGIIVLLQRIFSRYLHISLPFMPLSILFNAVPAYMAYRTVGKKFTLLSCLCIILYSTFTDLIPAFPITYDPLLISVFGGIINGMALVMVLNVGASSGGTDFVAMFFSVKKGISTWNYVMAFNVAMICISGLLFGMESALYTIIYQFVQTQVLNTMYKRYTRKTLFIVTAKPQAVSDNIMGVTHHSTTMFKAEGAYTHQPKYIIYTILEAGQLPLVLKVIREVDPHAFINVVGSQSVHGNYYQKPIE